VLIIKRNFSSSEKINHEIILTNEYDRILLALVLKQARFGNGLGVKAPANLSRITKRARSPASRQTRFTNWD